MFKSNCDSILFLNVAGNTQIKWKTQLQNNNKNNTSEMYVKIEYT